MISARFFSSKHDPASNEAVARFVADIVWPGADRTFDSFCSMGVSDGDEKLAGVIYHSMNEDTGVIELSAGADSRRWMTPSVLRMMLDIPFNFLGCQMVLHRVAGWNDNMLTQMRRFGYDEHVIPRMAGRDHAGHIFTMTDDAWKCHPLALRAKRG